MKKIKTRCTFNKSTTPTPSPPRENRAVYEIMGENIAEADRPRMTVWSMRFGCSMTKGSDTNSKCVILLCICTVVTEMRLNIAFVSNKINGNAGEPHTEGKNCDKRQHY